MMNQQQLVEYLKSKSFSLVEKEDRLQYFKETDRKSISVFWKEGDDKIQIAYTNIDYERNKNIMACVDVDVTTSMFADAQKAINAGIKEVERRVVSMNLPEVDMSRPVEWATSHGFVSRKVVFLDGYVTEKDGVELSMWMNHGSAESFHFVMNLGNILISYGKDLDGESKSWSELTRESVNMED